MAIIGVSPCDKGCDVMICFSQSTDRRDFIDGQKQRLWLKFSLDDVDISTSRDDGSSASMTSVEQQPSLVTRDDLEHDVQLMTQISQLSQQLMSKSSSSLSKHNDSPSVSSARI